MPFKKPEPVRPSALNFSAIFKGTVVTLAVSVAGSAFLGMLYYFTGLSEQTLPWFASAMLFTGVLLGGGTAAKNAGNKGLFHGIGVGVLYFLLIWIISAIFLPSQVAFFPLLLKLSLVLAGGALGGIVGVGLAR